MGTNLVLTYAPIAQRIERGATDAGLVGVRIPVGAPLNPPPEYKKRLYMQRDAEEDYMPIYSNWEREPAQTRYSLGSNPRIGTIYVGISLVVKHQIVALDSWVQFPYLHPFIERG